MAPINQEGQRDFDEIVHSLNKSDVASAYRVLSKYSLKDQDDLAETLSNMIPHPTAIAISRHDHAHSIIKSQINVIILMQSLIVDYECVEIIRRLTVVENHSSQAKHLLAKLRRGLPKWVPCGSTKYNCSKSLCSCILCKGAIMPRNKDVFGWKECKECKGIICPNCDCQSYHLSNQSQLWEDNDKGQENSDANKATRHNRKRSKRKKKRGALAPLQLNSDTMLNEEAPSRCESYKKIQSIQDVDSISKCTMPKSIVIAEERVDFVQYLQHTSSMIALDNLMSELNSKGYDFDGHLDIENASIQRLMQ